MSHLGAVLLTNTGILNCQKSVLLKWFAKRELLRKDYSYFQDKV